MLSFKTPILVHVTPENVCRMNGNGCEEYIKKVSAAVNAGVDIVQIRDKKASFFALGKVSKSLREAIGDAALIMINGDVEAAVQAQADGVHLPEKWQGGAATRGLLLGRSVHSLEAATRFYSHCHFLQIGTMYPSKTHPEKMEVEGLKLMEEVRCMTDLASRSWRGPLWDEDERNDTSGFNFIPSTLIGVGGINTQNAGDVIKAGADGVAVIRSISDASCSEEAADSAFAIKQAMCEIYRS
mmetsp:Transcript_1807/g.2551  ORF Transcript_1807/g.2551 Transcript_1807/m.2551 type:complete len:241 (+) Transcript_1807:132-854(+)